MVVFHLCSQLPVQVVQVKWIYPHKNEAFMVCHSSKEELKQLELQQLKKTREKTQRFDTRWQTTKKRVTNDRRQTKWQRKDEDTGKRLRDKQSKLKLKSKRWQEWEKDYVTVKK